MDKAIVFHSDILGFKEIIKNSEADQNDETLHRLKGIVDQSVGIIGMFNTLGAQAKSKITYKLFSDNLYASFSYTEGDITSFSDAFIIAVLFARNYFENMLNHQLAVRGGIAFGNDYSDDHIIFSMALVNAYTLESKKAIYPRIVVDNELIALLQHKLETPSPLVLDIINNSILKDEKDIFFLNPTGIAKDFKSSLGGHTGAELDKRFIMQNLAFANAQLQQLDQTDEEQEKVAKKYNWLIDILQWHLSDRTSETIFGNYETVAFGN